MKIKWIKTRLGYFNVTTILFYFVLYCFTLFYFVLFCFILFYFVLFCFILFVGWHYFFVDISFWLMLFFGWHYIGLNCIVLYWIALHFLNCIALYCIVLNFHCSRLPRSCLKVPGGGVGWVVLNQVPCYPNLRLG